MDCRFTKRVSVLGTGDFGTAIGKRLIGAGYDVTFGSRRPSGRSLSKIDPLLAQAAITNMSNAICANDVIIFAVRVVNFQQMVEKHKSCLIGKIVIDVSNRSKSALVATSNAEILQYLLPESTVVKAFNVISAYAMNTDFDGSSRVVPIASDNCQARLVVNTMAQDMGFQPLDAGMLETARKIETSVTSLFPMWRMPLLVAFVIFVLWWLYISYLYFIRTSSFNWEQLFVKLFNKPLAMTTINMLALAYMPGCIAGIYQLRFGTKYRRFPGWLDFWMKSRKQLGLTSFGLACLHAFISAMLLSPTYYRSWFHQTEILVHHNMTSDLLLTLPQQSWMTWKGELACLTGVLTFAIFCLLAITSLPTVSNTMNWVEWRFIQSRLGIVGLFLATSHAYVMGLPAWIANASDPLYLLHSITFMSSLFPSLVLLLRIALATPLISSRLRKIRRGWESDFAIAIEAVQVEKNGGHCAQIEPKKDYQSPLKCTQLNGNHTLERKCFCIHSEKPKWCCPQCKEVECLTKEHNKLKQQLEQQQQKQEQQKQQQQHQEQKQQRQQQQVEQQQQKPFQQRQQQQHQHEQQQQQQQIQAQQRQQQQERQQQQQRLEQRQQQQREVITRKNNEDHDDGDGDDDDDDSPIVSLV